MNRSSPVALLTLLALVALAGCGATPTDRTVQNTPTAPATGPSPPRTTAPPVSSETGTAPSTTPTSAVSTTSAQSDDYPPGVTSAGLVDATALAEAHGQVIRQRSFRFSWEATVTTSFANRTVVSNASTVGAATRNLTRIRLRTIDRQSDGNSTHVEIRERWVNRTTMVSRIEDGTQTHVLRTTRSMANGMGIEHQATGYVMIHDVLRRGNYAVVDRTVHDGVGVVTLRATDFTVDTPHNVSRFEATLVVDERGLVHELHYAVDFVPSDEVRLTSMHYGYELTRLGNVTVERPTWVTNATAESH